MLTTIAIVTVILLIALLGFAATRPDTFRLERAARMQARADAIFALIEDFRHWTEWSPYERLDPAMKKTYTGAPRGKGAVYEWAGNNKAGAGRMEITEISPRSQVVIKLDFIRPFEGHNFAEFTLEAAGEWTDVEWALFGPQSFLEKVFTTIISRDRLIGKDFERGLAKLKAAVETNNQRSAVCN